MDTKELREWERRYHELSALHEWLQSVADRVTGDIFAWYDTACEVLDALHEHTMPWKSLR